MALVRRSQAGFLDSPNGGGSGDGGGEEPVQEGERAVARHPPRVSFLQNHVHYHPPAAAARAPAHEAAHHIEGTIIGKCFYPQCAHPSGKQIVCSHRPDRIYQVCSDDCPGAAQRACVAVHYDCARIMSLEPAAHGADPGYSIERACTHCGEHVIIDTAIAWLELMLYWCMQWPWWMLTRVYFGSLGLGFAFKVLWFALLLLGIYQIDAWNNRGLVRPDGSLRPLALTDFRSYNFCKSQSDEYLAVRLSCMFLHCGPYVYCSTGYIRWKRIGIYGIYLPGSYPLVENDHFVMAAQFAVFFIAPLYLARRKMYPWMMQRLSRGFSITRVKTSRRRRFQRGGHR